MRDLHEKRFSALRIAMLFCSILILVALGVAFFLSNNAAIPPTPSSALEPSQIGKTEPAVAKAVNDTDGIDNLTVNTDEDFPVYEEGIVLANFIEGIDAKTAIETFAANEELAGTIIKEETPSYVKLELPSNLSVEHGLELLQQTDVVVSVQPNFYYYLMDEESGKLIHPDSLDDSPSSGETEFAFDGSISSNDNESALDFSAAKIPDSFFDGETIEPEEDLSEKGENLTAQATPNDSYYSTQWALPAVNAPAAWDYVSSNNQTSSNPITIAVFDAGFQVDHPDLKNRIVNPYNATTGQSDVSGREEHGTHVAGIVGAETNNGMGVSGTVNNLCKIMPVKVATASGYMDSSYLITGYNRILSLNRSPYNQNIRVINMSLGRYMSSLDLNSYTADLLLYKKIEEAYSSGIVTVVAACNDEDPVPYYAFPSDLDNVISVINLCQSSNVDGVTRDPSSNYNMSDERAKDISAPGTAIMSTYPINTYPFYTYTALTGTSMASPLVAGVVGLMLTADPSLTPDEVSSKLFSTATDIKTTGTGWDRQTGYGKVNAFAATDRSKPYISGNRNVYCGQTQRYTVEKTGVAQTNYTWTSSDPSIATIDSRTGVLTGKGSGEVIVTATGPDKLTTVKQTVTVYGILAPTSLASGYYVQCRVGPLAVDKWTWSISDSTFASINSSTGVLTAKDGDIRRNVSITVYATASNGKRISKVVTLNLDAPKVTMYRLYNPISYEHLYTADANERNVLSRGDWTYEGIAWTAPKKSSIPVFRLYNPVLGDHHYTTSTNERDTLKRYGWRYEGIGWYSDNAKRVPIYRQFHPGLRTGSHNFTKSKYENDYLVKVGWHGEGIAWYGM